MEAASLSVLLLAMNIFYEARWEPLAGKVAAAQVVMNRASRCGTSIEDELFRKRQFSWTNSTQRHRIILDQNNRKAVTEFSQLYSAAFLAFHSPDLTGGAVYYHRDDVSPKWAKTKKRITKIGRHIFYDGAYKCIDGTVVGKDVVAAREIKPRYKKRKPIPKGEKYFSAIKHADGIPAWINSVIIFFSATYINPTNALAAIVPGTRNAISAAQRNTFGLFATTLPFSSSRYARISKHAAVALPRGPPVIPNTSRSGYQP